MATRDDDPDRDPPAAPTGRLAELRGGDLLKKRPDELAAELSPEEVAQLAAWFDLPSFAELAESAPSADPAAAFDEIFSSIPGFYIPPEEIARVQKARAQALAAVDPSLVDYLERHLTTGDRLQRFRATLEVTLTPDRLVRPFRPTASAEVAEASPPGWVADDLQHQVPQALLRDLHRPEIQIGAGEPGEPIEPGEPPFDPLGEVKAIVAARYRFDAYVPPALETAAEGLAELAAIKASPWSEIRTSRRRVTE